MAHTAELVLRSEVFARPPQALLLDLDGTLYRGEARIDGADKLIEQLEGAGLPCWFLTNNSTRTPEQVADHLNRMGIPAASERVVTSAMATADYAARHYPEASAFVIGEQGLRTALRESGIRLLDDPDSAEQADLVIQGLDRQVTYDRLTEAVGHLLNGAVYLLTNPDRQLPVDGGILPGAGSLAALIEAASECIPTVIGKPSSIVMDYALAKAGVGPSEAWVIGDNPRTDLAAAQSAGCPSVLVLTGLCGLEDWRKRCEAAAVMPDAVCLDLAQLLTFVQAC